MIPRTDVFTPLNSNPFWTVSSGRYEKSMRISSPGTRFIYDDGVEMPCTSPVTFSGTSVYTDSPSFVYFAVSMPSPPRMAVTVAEREEMLESENEFLFERENSTSPPCTSLELPSITVAVNVCPLPIRMSAPVGLSSTDLRPKDWFSPVSFTIT